MYSLIVHVVAFVLLGACWFVGDLELRTKVIMTLVYVGTWLLVFLSPWAVMGAQILFSFVLWWMTFGPTGR
jgi:hypothetical protein